MKQTLKAAFLGGMVFMLPAVAHPQAGESVPRELAEALLGAMMGGGSGIRVGSAPVGFPASLTQDPLQVLGSLARGNMGQTVLATFLKPDSARKLLRARLLSEGFESRQQPVSPASSGGGFVSAGAGSSEVPEMLCKGSEFAFVSTWLRKAPAVGSLAMISVQRASGGMCDVVPNPEMLRFQGIPVPLLRLPDDAETDAFRGGGSSGGMDERTVQTTFRWKGDLAGLAKHFADQLVQQKWVPGPATGVDGLHVALYTFKNEQKEEYTGTLVIRGTLERRASFSSQRVEPGSR